MTTRRRTVRNAGAAVRPRYTWRQFSSLENVIVPGAQLLVSLANTGGWPDLIDLGVFGNFTVRRIHMRIYTTSALGTETNVMEVLHYGVGIFENDAVVANVFPEVDADPFDWFVYGSIGVSLASAGLTAGVHPMQAENVDNKSMRKVNANHQQPALLVQSAAANAGNVTASVIGRMLVSHGRG